MPYKLIAFNARYIHSCPALFYVRNELEKNLPGRQLEIIQYTINDPYYFTLQSIAAGEVQGVFFSVYIWNSLYIKRLLVDLVKMLPLAPVVLGGPQAQALAEDLRQERAVNCTVIQGEIEGVAGAFYKDLAGGNLQPTYECEKKAHFRSPYRQTDFAGTLQNRHIYYESSRGCPFSCTYCLSAAGHGVRHLDISQVVDELQVILKSAPKVIRFVDRTFNDLPDRALEIWRFLVDQPGTTLFHFEMAPDRFTEEMFQFLKRVEPQRFQFEIGVQSTNPETMNAINRRCDLEKLQNNIARLMALDTIHVHLDLILGLPYETWDTYRRSFNDVFALAPYYIQMGLLKVLPKTPIYQSINEFGLVMCEAPPYEILANKWLDKQMIAELFRFGECVEAFYNNRYFRTIWQYLRSRKEDIFCFFEALLALCNRKNFFDLAPTQELMSSLLLEVTQRRPDKELIRELLIFDWLRCGHHFLPQHFEQEPIAKHRKLVWKQMPQNWEGVYDYKSRDEFFKQGIFVLFSGESLREIGLSDDGKTAYVCFQANRENTVFRFNRFVLIPETILGS